MEKAMLRDDDYDDLAEVRELLKRTKGNLNGYGKGLYKFRNKAMKANVGAIKLGIGWSERNFVNMEKCFTDGDKTKAKVSSKVKTGGMGASGRYGGKRNKMNTKDLIKNMSSKHKMIAN